MLEFLRRHVGGFVGFALVGALVFAFALSFGQQSAGWGQGQDEYIAAKVQGESISEGTFKYAFNLLGGRNISSGSAEWNELRKAAVDGLIERQLLLNMAAKVGVSASRKEAEEAIIKNKLLLSTPIETHAERLASVFYVSAPMAARELLDGAYRVRQSFDDEKGNFDYEQLQKYIRYHLQMTEENFVEEQRLELIAQRMRLLLVSGVRVSQQEVRAAYDRENDTATLSYIRVFPSFFSDSLDPTPDDIATWAAANGDAIKQYYETNKYKYTNLEKMARARHILVKVAQDASDEERAKARAEADSILARIRSGEDFATLARQFSEDPGSGAKGGDLGYNPRGRMVPEFDEVMFALEPGALSDVVETKFGYHIIKAEGFREGNISIEDATGEIADQLYREEEGKRRARAAADGYLARLAAGEDIETLIPADEEGAAASPLRLRVSTSSPFARNASSIPGIGQAPEIVKAAFELSQQAPTPQQVFEVRGDFFVVTLEERVIPSDEDFAKKKDQMIEDLLVLKQASWLRARMKELRETAKKAGDIESDLGALATPRPAEAQDMGDENAPDESPSDRGAKKADVDEDKGELIPAGGTEKPAPATRAREDADDEGEKDDEGDEGA